MSNSSTTMTFFDACETGKGWQACQDYCHQDATFEAQADALAEVTTLEGYCEWMKAMYTPMPDAHYEMRQFNFDEDSNSALAFAVFHGTHTGEGGPVSPTGNSTASHYVYHIVLEDDRIRHVTKIWNDGFALGELGWR